VSLTSSDLELGADSGTDQLVGMRFNNMSVPPGASITGAYVEFEVDELSSEATSVTIQGQATDNAATFASATGNISTRTRTSAQVAWNNIPAWDTLNAKWQTPDMSSIIQEIVNRPGWLSGNSMVIIIGGTGRRTAEAYDGEAPAAPLLVITYMTGGAPTPTPTVTPTPTLTGSETPTPTGTPSTTFTPIQTGTATLVPTPVAEHRRQVFPPGSVRVSTDQPLGDLAVLLLEPAAPDSFFQWGFFHEVLSRTEYVEDYVMEPMAERMLAEDPDLAAQYLAKLEQDPDFRGDSEARLQWFYEKTPYFDERHLLYPVARELAGE